MRFPVVLIFSVMLGFGVSQRISTAKIGDNRYFISWHSPYAPVLNFHLAYQYCRTIAMELISFETAEEAQHVTDFLRSNSKTYQQPKDFWTSGNTLGSDNWLWMSNGSPLNSTFNYWPNGAEQAKEGGGCLLQANNAQAWKAVSCGEPHHFICEQTRCYFYNFNPFLSSSAASSTAGSTR